ncbi:MAG: DUF3054 domain-containing protein [Anaerolineales bacterium]|nr:DUF3054 domain-containing protein [Anaerolineales bacterium]
MKNKNILVLGDILAIAIVTIIGFVTHGEGSLEYLPRMAVAFFPLVITWLVLAPWFDLFSAQVVADLKMIWRPALTILFAAPLALIFRGLLLNAPILPIFAVVFTLTSAFGLVVWRFIYFLFVKK